MKALRFPRTAVALLVCVSAVSGCSDDEPEAAPEPLTLEQALPDGGGNGLNLLLITVDTLRADHLGYHGYGPPTSPAIDRLAEGGAVFENAFAPRGLTWPSLGTLMTSRYPVTHGVRGNAIPMEKSETTLAEILTAKGYACKGAVAPNASEQDWQGFEYLEGSDDENIASFGRKVLRLDGAGPFFVWLHFFGPHRPYDPPKEYEERFSPGYTGLFTGSIDSTSAITLHQKELDQADLDHIIGLYDASIAHTDDLIAGVLDTLDSLGLTDSTLVVFTSDHGEDLYEHHKYFNHLASIYDSSLHVPLIFSLPGVVPEGLRVGPLVETMDITPTILELLGFGEAATFDGTSLAPFLRGETLELGPAYSEWEDKMLSVRTDRFRYIVNPTNYEPVFLGLEALSDLRKEPFYQELLATKVLDSRIERLDCPVQEVELYDLDRDALNMVEDLDAYSSDLTKLSALIVDWQERYRWELLSGFEQNIDPEVQEKLEALGYVF